MKTVLFACVHNAGRSQIAAALFNVVADPSRARAISAGTQPAARVHPEVAEAMREVGLDLCSVRPRLLDEEVARQASLVVTMGCGESYPAVSCARSEDWPLDDPKWRPVEEVRRIRDDIKARVDALVQREGWARA